MSRRRGPRGRQRDTTSDQSQRILQIVLIGAGVLFLLIGAVIAAGISLPGTGALSDTGDNGGAATTPSGEQTAAPTTSEQTAASTTQQPTTQTTTQQPTTQQTSTPTPTPSPTESTTEATRTANSGGLNIINQVDGNGNGYISDFDLEIHADTRLQDTDPLGDGNPYFVVKINNEEVGQTEELDKTANGAFTIDIKPSLLETYERGQLQVTVELMDQDTGQDERINSWTQTVEYEPE